MPAADRLTVWAPAVASILLASIGVALAYTGAFPDVQCSGDLCLITWNVFTIPMMLILGTLGATAMYGGWYAGLVAGAPAWATTPPSTPELATAVRNSALATVAALLLGLVGAVIGGWMASGEPMRLGYYRRRDAAEFDRPRRVA